MICCHLWQAIIFLWCRKDSASHFSLAFFFLAQCTINVLLSVSFFQRRSITLMGLLWFPSSQNHGHNRGIGHFKWNLLLNVEYHSIERYLTGILFLGKIGTPLSGENIPAGVANVWDHPCVTLQTLPPPYPNSASMSKPAKELRRSLFAPQKMSCAVSQWPYSSGDMLYAKLSR